MNAPRAEMPLAVREHPYIAMRWASMVTLGLGAMFLRGISSWSGMLRKLHSS